MARSLALSPLPDSVRLGVVSLGSWSLRQWFVAVLATVVTAFLIGVPTDVVPTPLYRRMTPVTWWDYPIWAITAVLMGLLAATYVRTADSPRRVRAGAALGGGGIVSLLAVGCPVCNKLVVAALGASGALTYFGPAQPFLGLASVAILVAALTMRLRGAAACRVAAPTD